MAKSHNNLYNKITDYTNMDIALDLSVKGRMNEDAYPVNSEYFLRREFNLGNLRKQLLDNSWVPGKPRCFRLFEPKERDIQAPQFEDRIVHHSLNNIIEEHFTKRFIFHSYACIKGKGSQAACRAVQKMMRRYNTMYDNPYIVSVDISKYFNNINHDILLSIFNKTIKCKNTQLLYESIIRAQGYNFTNGVGLPVGSLTSQLSANMYLNVIDQRMVNYHGFGSYVRYMDDIVILCKDKLEAQRVIALVNEEVNKISLKLNPNSTIIPVKLGIDYVGYRIYLTHVLPRKRIIKNLRKDLKELRILYNSNLITFEEIRPRLASAIGYAKHCRSRNTMNKLIYEFLYDLDLL